MASARHPGPRRHRRHGLHARSASTGTSATDDLLIDASSDGARRRPASTLDDVDAFWLGTMGSGLSGLHAQPAR